MPQMFGSHLSIAGGMHNALLAAEALQLQTVQVFTKNQQQWAAKPLDAATVTAFRGHAARLGFEKMVAHDSYLINLASMDETPGGLLDKSIAAFGEEMRRCDQLGIAYLVTHPGAHCGAGEACGIERVARAMNSLLERQRDGHVTVCLETTAGQGSCLGCRFEQLAEMITRIDHPERIGICVDTCHILAAGYDITTADATRRTLDELDRVIGIDRVNVWHLNDSKKPLGSRVDRHEHIGRGCVGLEAFEVICRDERFREMPKILETAKEKAPDGRPWDEINLAMLRALAEGERPRLIPFPTTAAAPTTKKAPPKRKAAKSLPAATKAGGRK